MKRQPVLRVLDRRRIEAVVDMVAELLRDVSAWVWSFLRDTPFRPREETVTEVALSEVYRRGGRDVWFHKTTVSEESVGGADIALAVRAGSGWLVVLVQAKNIDGTRFGVYKGMRGVGAKRQAKRLLRSAALAQAIPIYAFYNSELPPFGRAGTKVIQGGCCAGVIERGTHSHPWRSGVAPLGVTIAHAQDVVDYAIPGPARNQHARNINRFAMPWECLVCPRRSIHSSSNPTRIARAMEALTVRKHSQQQTGFWAEPPTWAALVMEGLDPSDDADAPIVGSYLVVGVSPHQGEED